MENRLPSEVIDRIFQILKRGNSAEIKKERDNIVVVEIERHVRIKHEMGIVKE